MSQNIDGFGLYDENFYKKNLKTEYAADTIVNFLFGLFKPQNVIDIGCGRGAWLVACKNAGAKSLYGMDGPWNSQADMLDQSICFSQADLSGDIILPIQEKFDLCISLEVAEHLEQRWASRFISSLCSASDLILFSAAFVGQGGTGHLNENIHSYWAGIFKQHGFVPFDVIRPRFWGDERMDFWYKQNIFLYIRNDSPKFSNAIEHGFSPIEFLPFMDAVHPDLYKIKCNHIITTRELIKRLPFAVLDTLKHRLRIARV